MVYHDYAFAQVRLGKSLKNASHERRSKQILITVQRLVDKIDRLLAPANFLRLLLLLYFGKMLKVTSQQLQLKSSKCDAHAISKHFSSN